MTDADGLPIYSYTTVNTGSPNRYFDIDGSFKYKRNTRKKG